jgi:hypothetical protein
MQRPHHGDVCEHQRAAPFDRRQQYFCGQVPVRLVLVLLGKAGNIFAGVPQGEVSWEDYDFLLQWPWTYAISHFKHGDLVYARRSVREGDRNVCGKFYKPVVRTTPEASGRLRGRAFFFAPARGGGRSASTLQTTGQSSTRPARRRKFSTVSLPAVQPSAIVA